MENSVKSQNGGRAILKICQTFRFEFLSLVQEFLQASFKFGRNQFVFSRDIREFQNSNGGHLENVADSPLLSFFQQQMCFLS
jgi:hypothetical protein